jgi:hypothetical protein
MEEEIRALIQGIPGVPASINWGAMPRGTPLPGVVLNVISDLGTHHQEGPTDVSEARVQVDVYAATYGEAKLAARAIRKVLDGYKGGTILGAFLQMARDSSEEGETPDERAYRVMQDFGIIYRLDV